MASRPVDIPVDLLLLFVQPKKGDLNLYDIYRLHAVQIDAINEQLTPQINYTPENEYWLECTGIYDWDKK